MISQENFIKAWENKRLVAGALKVASVRYDYVNYEDLMQDGVLLYAQLLEKWPDKNREEVDKLAFRKIIWQTIDELRKIQRHEERNTTMEGEVELTNTVSLDWNCLLVLKDEIKKLDEIESMILFNHLLANKTITQLARESGLARVTLQRNKRKLLQKLRQQF